MLPLIRKKQLREKRIEVPGGMNIHVCVPDSSSRCIIWQRISYGISTYILWNALQIITGASFVLSGSLHGAIISQVYGIPWAAYNDGYVDVSAKWFDWAAYLGVDIQFVKTLKEGKTWWEKHGKHGRIRSLSPLLRSFPYKILNPYVERLAQDSSF
ncbi:MAG: hypothetical protein HQM08_02280 [Candidatus Riflebacteria bacterium]|nr:hypothetical protein [Candidatus Riflebacteria bacterium]